MKRPCNCNRSFPGEPFADRVCNLCWHAMNTPAYQTLWGIDPQTLAPMTPEQLAARPKAIQGHCRGCLGEEAFDETRLAGTIASLNEIRAQPQKENPP